MYDKKAILVGWWAFTFLKDAPPQGLPAYRQDLYDLAVNIVTAAKINSSALLGCRVSRPSEGVGANRGSGVQVKAR